MDLLSRYAIREVAGPDWRRGAQVVFLQLHAAYAQQLGEGLTEVVYRVRPAGMTGSSMACWPAEGVLVTPDSVRWLPAFKVGRE
ncbi:hypothetical protein K7W42_18335 [Deinococcus sp. HMF7604]|uniref:hypothetical protein n=1 Tax=Deinococcus betulae TaxID=2873312 RepID=UPI001CCA6140|nr:hypothetical protein [Deinococcus betulae]MBZ9752802.1 hypothetical protein [Deinococcus betulae]